MIVGLLAWLGTGCTSTPPEAPALRLLRGDAFGTTWSVKWLGSEPTEDRAAREIASVLEEVGR